MILRQPDWCSPWGIVRPALPPDDASQDALCALAAAVNNAYLDLHLDDDGPGVVDPRQRNPQRGGSITTDRTSRSDAGGRPSAGRPLHTPPPTNPTRTP